MVEDRRLYKYQEDGVRLIQELGTNVLLADPPGAGKSAQVVRAAVELKAQKILVICPASLRLNWCREFDLWAPENHFATWPVLSGKKLEAPISFWKPSKGFVIVVSYQLTLQRHVLEWLMRTSWDLLVFDEAHQIKSATSKTARVCLIALWSRAARRVAITGTPLPNGRASEAWPLFRQMSPKHFGSWKPFRNRYCGKPVELGRDRGYKVFYPTSKNLDELGTIARKNFMIRRPLKECLAELPSIVRQYVPLAVSRPEVLAAQNDLPGVDAEGILELFEKGEQTEALSTLRRKLGELKAQSAAELVLDLLEEQEQIVVFAHHKSVVAILIAAFEAAGVTLAIITGSDGPEARQKAVDDFQAGKARVFLASLTAANTGITLTAASTVVNIEPSWTPMDNEQAEARVYRKGQKSAIIRAIYPIVPESLDEGIIRSVTRKQRDIVKALGV